tara:strand:+ start:274 stop:423 length:150 start_codon:yes stop_codon:yes gene_type:complete
MTEKIDWKEELLDYPKFNKKQENLLKNGTKSLTDIWLAGWCPYIPVGKR